MSRHRNVRNLTPDDYDDYGDDDDYYDDYDEEDEDEYYYKQQQEERKRREREEALKRSHGVEAKIAAQKQKQQQQQQQSVRKQPPPSPGGVAAAKSAPSSSATPAGVGVGVVSPGEKTERVRLLEGMGFTPVQAKSALEQYDWEVQKALDSLLLGGGGGGGASAGEMTKKKVPSGGGGGGGGGKKKGVAGSSSGGIGGGGGGGVSKPPPGFGRPDAAKKKKAAVQQDSGSAGGGGISKPPPGFARPPPPAGKSKDEEERLQKRAMMEQFDASPPPGFGGGRKGASSVSPKKDTLATTPTKEVKFEKVKKGLSPPRTTPSDATSSSSSAADGPIPQLPQKVVDALKKQRSRLSMVILGHVDAGKSTLMGQVLLQLGHVEKRTVTKYQRQAAELGKASFALAWVMDEDESERERGVTMEIGTKYAKTPNHDLTILDAPGHADFIPAMITGAASADVGLLVVAATPGEFEAGFELTENTTNTNTKTIGGQTREHIILSRGLGVSQLIVAINKLDASDPPWSQSRFEYIKSRLVPFLQLNGYNMKRVRFVPISGYYGINVKEKPNKETGAELLSWYDDGLTLLESIDGFLPAQRNLVKPLRFIVTDVYSEGKGVTARGRVVQGAVQIGEKVVVLPIGDTALVNKIEHGTATSASSSPYSYASSSTTTTTSEDNNDTDDNELLSFDRTKLAIAGDTVDISLTSIDIARITPGCILSHTHNQLRPPVQKKIQAKILVMDQLDVPIIRGAQVLLHMHSIDVPATITKLLSSTKKLHNKGGTKEMTMPRVVTGGSSATVEIKMNERICVETYSDCRSLGRFVLRRGGSTIAVGVVEKILG